MLKHWRMAKDMEILERAGAVPGGGGGGGGVSAKGKGKQRAGGVGGGGGVLEGAELDDLTQMQTATTLAPSQGWPSVRRLSRSPKISDKSLV